MTTRVIVWPRAIPARARNAGATTSRALCWWGDAKLAGSCPRLSAPEIENQIVSAVQRHLASRARPGGDLNLKPDLQTQEPWLTFSCSSMYTTSLDREQQIAKILAVIERVTVHASKVEIVLNESYAGEGEVRSLTFPFARTPTRRNRQVIARSESSDESSRAMRTRARAHFKVAMSNARRWLDELIADPAQTIEAISARENRSPRSLRMTLSLAFLSPELVKAALEGRLPRGLNARRMTDMPLLWSDQWGALGLQVPSAA